MNTIEIKTTTGETATVSAEELHRTVLTWLREYSPSNEVILAEETNNEGMLVTTPVAVAVLVLLKNPETINPMIITDTISLEKTDEQ